MPASGQKLPVAILTGYLGAGKTTLLNYVLHEQQDKRLAVIENEVGEVSIDDALVEHKHEDLAEELVVLDNGCICCTIRGDLVKTLQDLAKKVASGHKLDGVLIELTGAADPAPVVQTFMVDPDSRRTFYIDNVICLVDAKHAVEKLDESKGDPNSKGTAGAQIAFASTVLLNKVDLVSPAELEEAEKRIVALNRSVDIIRCEKAQAPLDRLFGVRAFDLAKVLDEQYMDEEEFNSFYKPKMDNSISNVGVRFEGAISLPMLQMFLDRYLDEEETAKDFLRVKGVFNIVTSDKMFVLQCVHMLRNQNFTKPWPEGKPRENKVIFIGRGMQQRRQELTEGIRACVVGPLRFKVGTVVMARTGDHEDDRERGRIVKHWDEFQAYRIMLDSGDEVRAPLDLDCYVMAP
jgi:G3E family GTPase